MDLVEMAEQAVDGTKIRANAAKDRTYDAAGLRRLLGRLEGAIDELEAQKRDWGGVGYRPSAGEVARPQGIA